MQLVLDISTDKDVQKRTESQKCLLHIEVIEDFFRTLDTGSTNGSNIHFHKRYNF